MEALQLSQIASQLLERDAKRSNLPIQIFEDTTELLAQWNSDFDDLSQNVNKLEELTLCFRVLRNSCVKCERNQNEIMKLTTVLTTLKVLQKICEDYSSKYHSALLCGCQFLGNLVAGNTTNQQTTWSLVFPTFLKSALKINSPKVTSAVVMMMYNLMKGAQCARDDVFSDTSVDNLSLVVIEKWSEIHDQDWVVLCITDHFLPSGLFLSLVFDEGSLTCKSSFLDALDHIFETGDFPFFPQTDVLNVLSTQLMQQCGDISLMEEATSQDAIVTTKLLHTLSVATSSSNESREILAKCSLLKTVVDILRRVILAGKLNESSVFANSNKPSPAAGAKEPIHPVMGFKRDLVRIIGNLSYKNLKVQDEVRDLEGLPLIFECCNIDERNPFIRQWAVFAIRNLCENNAENQAILAQLERHSVVENPIFQNSGLEVVESSDGHLSIKPVT